MTIDAGTLINVASTISSGKDMSLNVDHLENRSQILGETYDRYYVGTKDEAYQSCKRFFFIKYDCKTKTRSINVVKKETIIEETGRLDAVISAKGTVTSKAKTVYNEEGSEAFLNGQDYASTWAFFTFIFPFASSNNVSWAITSAFTIWTSR